MMVSASYLVLPLALGQYAVAQSTGWPGGIDLDRPMLGGGPRRGDSAMLRFGCSQVVVERLDPLVNPGMNPSSHVHDIVGGNAFKPSMPYTDIAKEATCTTCHFKEDLSNYWVASLYFQARNGSYKRVPVMANEFNTGDNGGITVYYTAPRANATTAFKPGFRMLTGESTRRTSQNLGRKQQHCYRCYTKKNFGGSSASPCLDAKWDTDHLPNQPCEGGIRYNVIFPLCWDGKNLDSPNHMDHVSHPVGGATQFAVVTPECPPTHPIKIPQLMFEVAFDTAAFSPDKVEWPEDGSQPFVLSTGDKTGYGAHGDYVFGWEGDSLQRSMDNKCYLRNCTQLFALAPEEKNKCQVPVSVDEEVDGWLTELPGGGEA